MMEEFQNFSNWNKATVDVPVLKWKRILARKMHKLKKILKVGSKSLVERSSPSLEQRQNAENEELERRQNYENERLERSKFCYADEYQYDVNENWENWDCCYLCAGQTNFYHCQRPQPPPPHQRAYNYNSICYVFMPGQSEPVPVKLRTAKIPGGVMWISYRPDVDIHSDHNLYSFTSSQIPQGQHPIVV